MSNQDIQLRAETSENIGLSFSGKMSREQVMDRLMEAQRKAIAASKELMSDEYKFNGEEINGPRR